MSIGRRISSRVTVVYKWVFPVAFVGVMLSGATGDFFDGSFQEAPFTVALPFILGVLVISLFFIYFRPLADRVNDCGDHLDVWRGKLRVQIALSNIEHLSAAPSRGLILRRLILRLRVPSEFGSLVSFFPAFTFALSSTDIGAIGESLLARSGAANDP